MCNLDSRHSDVHSQASRNRMFQSETIVAPVSSLVADVREAATETILGVAVGRKATLRVIRVL